LITASDRPPQSAELLVVLVFVPILVLEIFSKDFSLRVVLTKMNYQNEYVIGHQEW